MKLCIVGIGGAGGRITQEFLGNEGLGRKLLAWVTGARYVSSSRFQGIWLEADKHDAENMQHFFKDLTKGAYPGFFIPYEAVTAGSELDAKLRKKYGYDVRKLGFLDPQNLKAIFEIFDTDKEIQEIAAKTTNLITVQSTLGVSDRPSAFSQKSPDAEAGSDTEGIPKPTLINGNITLDHKSNPIYDSTWNAIKPYTILGEGDCDCILFIISLGGRTGSGFINPIINHIRNVGKADYPIFTLGILTESSDFADMEQHAVQGRRDLNAINALYDLLTKSDGANGVILIDNTILMERFGNNLKSANEFIYKVMQPIIAASNYPGGELPSKVIAQYFSAGVSLPPIFVPLYASQPRKATLEESLINKALTEGRLFGCTPEKADRVMVLCRGFINSEKVRQAISSQTGIETQKIWVLGKMDKRKDEVLILLRNPYGSDPYAYEREGTLENRFYNVITTALSYIAQNREVLFYKGKDSEINAQEEKDDLIRPPDTYRYAISQFFFGKDGFVYELSKARWRLERGEKPFFLKPLRIFPNKEIAKGDNEQI